MTAGREPLSEPAFDIKQARLVVLDHDLGEVRVALARHHLEVARIDPRRDGHVDALDVDPERAVAAVADIDAWLYRLVQFAIRETVAARTLDEVLSAKAVLDAELRTYVSERVADTGIEVIELGVKDVILPGDVRELLNKVVEAERTAKANLIRRQEETAATRSLLNTAKLMEENPLLLRLKELESLERLVEKVGRIDLHAGEGQGLDALLDKLVRLKVEAAG